MTVSISTPGLLEIWVDGNPYFGGDFYSFRKAPLLLALKPGTHVLEIRLVRDVRALGGSNEPLVTGIIEVNQTAERLLIDSRKVLTGEMVNGRLTSSLASVNIHNPIPSWVEIVSIRTVNVSQQNIATAPATDLIYKDSETILTLRDIVRIAPYQTRPAVFRINRLIRGQKDFSFEVEYRIVDEPSLKATPAVKVELQERSMDEPQKYTFLHPGGILSYAIIRPPVNNSCFQPYGRPLPILLSLHGAGLEADDETVRHMLDDAYGVCAWIIFPTGVTPWSGDDWRGY